MKKKKTWIFAFALLVFSIFIPVMAEENNFYASDASVRVEEDVEASTFAASNNVSATSRIDGIGFFAGNLVSVSGMSDYVFAAGNIVNVTGVTTKDIFVAGNSLTIQDSVVRDLYATGASVHLTSDVERNAYLAGDEVVIDSYIGGDLKVACSKLHIGSNAVITGTLSYPEDIEVVIEENASVNEIEKYVDNNNATIKANTFATMMWSFVMMLVVGFVFLAMNKKAVKDMKEVEKSTISFLKTTLIGFGTLCLTPIACVLLLLTVVGVPLSLLAIIIYGITIYISAIPTAYYFSTWFIEEKVPNLYFSFALSLCVLYILRFIPWIGGFVTFFSLCFGLGMFTLLVIQNMKKEDSKKNKKEK